MKLNKLSVSIGNIFGAATLAATLAACGSGGLSDVASVSVYQPDNVVPSVPQNSTNYGSIPASRIILEKRAPVQGKMIRIQASDLPDNVQVLASQVVVDTNNNNLTSTNLQTVLDTEIAVDLTTNIVGVWNIENISGGRFGSGPAATGQVEFKADGTFVVLSGGFAAPGTTVSSAPWMTSDGMYFLSRLGSNLMLCEEASQPSSYRVVDGVVVFTFGPRKAFTTVLKNSADVITLMGMSGNGCSQEHSISRLTRATTAAPASLKSNPSKYTPPKPVGKVALAG